MPKHNDLTPTGNCYEETARLLVDPFNSDYADWTLVHGRPVLQRPPFIRYGHAWLEKDGEVYDPSAGVRMPVFFYYALGQITKEEMYRYSRKEARRHIITSGHWGPWEGIETDMP